jgi:hypothetical protein
MIIAHIPAEVYVPEGTYGAVYPILKETPWENIVTVRVIDIIGPITISSERHRIVRPLSRFTKATYGAHEVEITPRQVAILKPAEIEFSRAGKSGASRFMHTSIPDSTYPKSFQIFGPDTLGAFVPRNKDLESRQIWNSRDQTMSYEEWLIPHGETAEQADETCAFMIMVREGTGEGFLGGVRRLLYPGLCVGIDPGERYLLAGEDLRMDAITITDPYVIRMLKAPYN